MRHTGLVAATAAVTLLSVASSRLVLPGQASPDPATEFVPALSVAESEGLLKLPSDTGLQLFELGRPGGVRAVAADDRRSLVCAYTPGTLGTAA